MSPLWPSANHYHEQPGDQDGDQDDASLEPGRKLLARAEQAEEDGDEEQAQMLRRLLGD